MHERPHFLCRFPASGLACPTWEPSTKFSTSFSRILDVMDEVCQSLGANSTDDLVSCNAYAYTQEIISQTKSSGFARLLGVRKGLHSFVVCVSKQS